MLAYNKPIGGAVFSCFARFTTIDLRRTPQTLAHCLFLLATALICPLANAQILIDDYGFYRSWQELNDRYYRKQVEIDEQGLERGTDTRTRKLTEQGNYRVSVTPESTQLSPSGVVQAPFNQIHGWLIQVETADGATPTDVELEFYGGMPLHNHGFPTSPQITQGNEPGKFHLTGIKFSMTGWWQFALALKSADAVDTVRFNLVIKP